MSEDPLGYVDGASLYGYVGGNPTDFNDPFGRKKFKVPDGWAQRFVDKFKDQLEDKGKDWLLGKLKEMAPHSKTIGEALRDGAMNDLEDAINDDFLAKLAGLGSTAVNGLVKGVKAFADCPACCRWYVRTMKALIAAHKGNRSLCDTIKPGGGDGYSSYGKCFRKLEFSDGHISGVEAAEMLSRLAKDAMNACYKCRAKSKTRAGK